MPGYELVDKKETYFQFLFDIQINDLKTLSFHYQVVRQLSIDLLLLCLNYLIFFPNSITVNSSS